ncbi:MAG: S8 family serine peptidase [Bacteroidales bacterium]|nr:S8 family serine peptidase [Bacteroidales bacterium]
MNKRSFLAAALACSLFGACQRVDVVEQPVEIDKTSEDVADSPATISGTVNVQFTSEMADLIAEVLSGDSVQGESLTKAMENPKAEALRASMAELGIKSMSRIFPDAGEWEPRHRAAGLHTWYRVTYDDALPHTKAAASLQEIPGVTEVEIPRKVQKMATAIPFNDPYRGEQWGLYNDGSKSKFKKGMDINVVPVWNNITAGSSEVIVAVVDGGIDMSHPDLKGVVIPAGPDGSKSFVYNYEGYEISADGHGTHVGGIIGAINNNGVGVSSVAGGNNGKGGVRLLSCQMFKDKPGSNETYNGNSAQAIVWGADHGAVISQNSWGYVYETEAQAKNSNISSSDRTAVNYFIKNAGTDANGNQVGPMKGGVVIFAAGNEAFCMGWPAAYEPIIAVGAIGPDGKRTTYSNYGPWVDICAPGGEADRFNNNASAYILSLYPNNGMVYMCGTSQACPHVSGVAALLVSHYGGPGFTNEMLKEKLFLGANYAAPSNGEQIGPMLDAMGSFGVDYPIPPTMTPAHTDAFTLKSHESKTIKYVVNPSLIVPLRSSVTSDCPAVSSTVSDDGKVIDLIIDALKAAPGKYKAVVRAEQYASCYAEDVVEFTILPNHAPKATGEVLPSIIVENKSERVSIDMSQYVTDEDGEPLKYQIDASDPEKIGVSISDNVITIRPNAYGEAVCTITAIDARGEAVKLNAFTFMAFDKSSQDGFTAYPNPVVDVLRIHTGMTREMDFKVLSSNGVTVLSGTVTGSVLAPAKLSFKDLAPGRYSLVVSYEDGTFTKTIVKK